MTKFLIDTFAEKNMGQGITWRVYETREQYDADPYSRCGYERERAAFRWPASTTLRRQYGGPLERYSDEPESFPCLQLRSTWARYNPDGPDLYQTFYVYDFTQVDDSEEDETFSGQIRGG